MSAPTSPAVSKLLDAVREFNEIAKAAFADGDNLRGAKAITISVEFLSAARAMQQMNDAMEELESSLATGELA